MTFANSYHFCRQPGSVAEFSLFHFYFFLLNFLFLMRRFRLVPVLCCLKQWLRNRLQVNGKWCVSNLGCSRPLFTFKEAGDGSNLLTYIFPAGFTPMKLRRNSNVQVNFNAPKAFASVQSRFLPSKSRASGITLFTIGSFI